MAVKNIVIGQKVDASKVQRARELRRQMTPEEQTLWKALRGNRLHGYHFRRQQIIDGFIVDFYCHKAGLIVELDGSVHDQQVDYDTERDRILTGRGLYILRFRNQKIQDNLEGVLLRISEACHTTIA
jgi:very-short-patch-repair endonuclease